MKEKIKLLMVDDSVDILRRLKELLVNTKNIECIKTANTLLEAMHTLNHFNINTLTLDISLPDGSGLNFVKWVKEKHPMVRVIMLSNHANEFYRKAAAQYGSDYFLDKTIEFDRVHHTILNTNL